LPISASKPKEDMEETDVETIRCKEEIAKLMEKENELDKLIAQRQVELERLSESNSKYPFCFDNGYDA